MAKAIGTLGTVDTITVNNCTFTDLTNLIITFAASTTAGRYGTARLASGTAGYQVTAGKTYTIRTLSVNNGGNTSIAVTPLYGDTDVGIDSAAAPTTAKYIGNNANFDLRVGVLFLGGATSGLVNQHVLAMNFGIPATKYAAVQSNISNTFTALYGYEA